MCAASKRFILEAADCRGLHPRKFVDAVAALKMGDPRDEQNYVGPMARIPDLRDELHQQARRPLMKAQLCCWGRKNRRAGSYYAPTVLGNVTAGMNGFRQELFGPVATLTTARDADHALALANDSEFGLSANGLHHRRGAGPALLPASWSAASSSMATAPATPAWPSAA